VDDSAAGVAADTETGMSRDTAKRELARGFGWRMGATLTGSAVQFLVGIALARLVAPEAYGLYTLVNVFVMLGDTVGGFGMEQAVVQAASIERDDVRVAFTTSTVASALVAMALWLGADVTLPLMHEPALPPLLRWGTLAVLAQGAGATARGLLLRDLRFRELAIAETGGALLGNAAVSLTLAGLGYGASALVAGLIAANMLRSAVAYGFARHSVRPSLDRRRARSLLVFGAGIAAAGLLNWIAIRGSSAVGGIVLGISDLGLYNRGIAIAFAPFSQVFQSASYALYPTACRMRASAGGLEWLHLRILEASALAAVPISAFAVVLADSIVLGLLGPVWAGAAIVVQVLGLVLFARAAYNLQAALLRAEGAVGWLTAAQGAYGIVTTGLTWWLGSRYGLAGAAAALSVAIVVMLVLITWRAMRITRAAPSAVWRAMRPGSLLGGTSLAVCVAVRALGRATQWPSLATLFVGGAAFAASVAAYLMLLPESATGRMAKNALRLARRQGLAFAAKMRVRCFAKRGEVHHS